MQYHLFDANEKRTTWLARVLVMKASLCLKICHLLSRKAQMTVHNNPPLSLDLTQQHLLEGNLLLLHLQCKRSLVKDSLRRESLLFLLRLLFLTYYSYYYYFYSHSATFLSINSSESAGQIALKFLQIFHEMAFCGK